MIFELIPMLVLLAAAIAAGVVGAVVGGRRATAAAGSADPPSAMGTAAEMAFLTLFGGFVARAFVGTLIEASGGSRGARLLLGWAFGLVPGIVDTIAAPSGAQPLTNASALLAIVTAVGAFTGWMAGYHRIYEWKGAGVGQLLGDVVWGLAGSTTAALVGLFNVFFGDHADDGRTGAHRYPTGFRLKKDFAFTQGNVMSCLTDVTTAPLYKHERLHVFQNRVFGPLFMLTYLAWMAVWFVPSLIASGVKWDARFIEGWCYRSNPWEIWAYYVQRKAAGQAEGSDFRSGGDWSRFTFSETTGIGLSIPFFILAVVGVIAAVVVLW